MPPTAGPELNRAPNGQRFVCDLNYSQKECTRQIAVLQKAVERYPVSQLGEWTWVLLRSDDWKELLSRRRLDPDSPAFTYLQKRETFIEEALVSPVAGRNGELIQKWSMGTRELLDLAVRHELGHALCKEPNERRAYRVAESLQRGDAISCDASAKAKNK